MLPILPISIAQPAIPLAGRVRTITKQNACAGRKA
jgi:hypothetical protein